MGDRCRLTVDLANVFDDKDDVIATLAWGDTVVVEEATVHDRLIVRHPLMQESGSPMTLTQRRAYIKKRRKGQGLGDVVVATESSEAKVLKVDMVDVQQGDAAVIETPAGRTILIDGGDNQLFARYLAARFPGSSAAAPKEIDCIVVTHGDADHFSGLVEIHKSETAEKPWKRLFIHPRRVFHNGLVKRPTKKGGKRVPEAALLGATKKSADGRRVIVGLEQDLIQVPDEEMNTPFKAWKRVLATMSTRGAIEQRSLAFGDDDSFAFVADEGIAVKVLGPQLTDAGGQQGLVFLGEPTDRIGRPPGAPKFKGTSASHTINGHSVILHLTFGSVRFLFAGDLNEEAEEALTAAAERGDIDLEAEVLKVPHHGSADFHAGFLGRVAPVVSVVSSGDENARKEYIHPRATLMAALGRHSRAEVAEPVVLVTELAAFFNVEGWVAPDRTQTGPGFTRRTKPFFAFSRTAFGLVKVRTDGERLLVFTYSGKDDLKEAYAFTVAGGQVRPERIRKV